MSETPTPSAPPAPEPDPVSTPAAPARRRRRGATIAASATLGVGLVLGAGVGAVALGGAEDAPIGTGYAAMAACTHTYIMERALDSPDLPDHPLTGLISTSTNLLERSARASIFGLHERTAYYIDGLGCVLNGPAESLLQVSDTGARHFPTQVPPIADRVEQVGAVGGGVPQPEASLPPAEDERVQAAIDRAMEREGARAVVIMRDGALVAERYAPRILPTTRQLGWSMTKSVASVLAGRVAQDSANPSPNPATPNPAAFGPDTAGLWPGWGAEDERSAITVDSLLRMTSGLAWEEGYDTSFDTARMLYGRPSADMAAEVASHPLEHAPGSYREYSTGGPNLLCHAAQRALAPTAAEAVDLAWRSLFLPLGMASAELAPDSSGTLVCGSSMYATPRDWAKLGQFMLNDGIVDPGARDRRDAEGRPDPRGQRLLPEGWVAASFREKPVDAVEPGEDPQEQPTPYGAGWWLNEGADGSLRFPDLPRDLVWADGHDGQFMVLVPSANLLVVRQGFSPGTTVEDSGTLDIIRAALPR